MLNKIILSGNIGRRPEIKITQQGKEMATFFLATHLPWKVCAYKNEEEEGKEIKPHTDWHRITVFRESSVSWIKNKLKQGDTVYVEGRLSYNSWQDRHNQMRLTSHVVVEDWQGHVEYLRSSKASFERNKGELRDTEESAIEPQMLALMEESLQTASDFFSSPLLFSEGEQSQGDTTQENKSQGDIL